MKKKSNLKIKGEFDIRLYDSKGNLKEERHVTNTLTSLGKAGIADQLLASPTGNFASGKPTHMAIGTGSPAATLLGTEISRVALTSKTRSGAVVTMVGDWAAGVGTGAITEAGIFDVGTANTVNMISYASFSAINKAAGDTLSITWTYTIG